MRSQDCYIFVLDIKKNHIPDNWNAAFSDSDRIQTCNLLIRSQMLYSVELRSRLQLCCYISLRS